MTDSIFNKLKRPLSAFLVFLLLATSARSGSNILYSNQAFEGYESTGQQVAPSPEIFQVDFIKPGNNTSLNSSAGRIIVPYKIAYSISFFSFNLVFTRYPLSARYSAERPGNIIPALQGITIIYPFHYFW